MQEPENEILKLKMNKIIQLTELLDKNFNKKFNILSKSSHISQLLKYFNNLKKIFTIHDICLTEIKDNLCLLGLNPIVFALLSLKNLMKQQLIYFCKFSIHFFQIKEYEKPVETKKSSTPRDINDIIFSKNDLNLDQLKQLKLLFKKLEKKSNNEFLNLDKIDNKFERLEKAKFFLEQETNELEKMIIDYNNSNDEITEFLKMKTVIMQINPSGAIKFLQNMLRENKILSKNLSTYLLEGMGDVDKNDNIVNQTEIFNSLEMKNNIINKVDTGHRKFLQNLLLNQKNKGVYFIDVEIQTDEDNKTHNENDGFGNFSSYSSIKKQLVSAIIEKKDLISKNEFWKQKNDQLSLKITNNQKRINKLESDKEELLFKINEFDYKIIKKKNKLKYYKNENKDLLEKLSEYVDKDMINKNLIKLRNNDIENNQKKDFEKEKEMINTISDLKTKNQNLSKNNEDLLNSISNFKDEIKKLNDLIELLNNKTEIIQISTENTNKSLKKRRTTNKFRSKVNSIIDNLDTKKKNNEKTTDFQIHENEENDLIIKIKEKNPKEFNEINNFINKFIDSINENNSKILLKNFNLMLQTKDLNIETVLSEREKNKKKINDLQTELNENKHKINNINEKCKNKENTIIELQDKINNLLSNNQKDEKNIENLSPKIINNNFNNSIFPLETYDNLISKISEENLDEINSKTNYLNKNINKKLHNKSPSSNIDKKLIINNEINKNMFEKIEKTIINKEKIKKEKTNLASTKSATPNNFHRKIISVQRFETEPNDETYNRKFNKIKTKRNSSKTFSDLNSFIEKIINNTNNDNEKINDESFKNDNLAKLKYLYKYPFKKLNNNFTHKDINLKDNNINEEFFESIYNKIVESHKKCGPNCEHLKRFYKKIPFINKYLHKEEYQNTKILIDKLPKNLLE